MFLPSFYGSRICSFLPRPGFGGFGGGVTRWDDDERLGFLQRKSVACHAVARAEIRKFFTTEDAEDTEEFRTKEHRISALRCQLGRARQRQSLMDHLSLLCVLRVLCGKGSASERFTLLLAVPLPERE
jgi:hypothetical protein